LRARSNAGSARANNGFFACSIGLGFIASRPSLAGQGGPRNCRRAPTHPPAPCR
jgi:hypothetical protein